MKVVDILEGDASASSTCNGQGSPGGHMNDPQGGSSSGTSAAPSPRNDGGAIKCPIGKVHGRVRGVDPDAYEPMVVSLGPYHAGRHHLRRMEKDKPFYAHSLCDLTGKGMVDYLEAIRAVRDDARRYYVDGIDDLKNREDRNGNNVADVEGVFPLMLLDDAAFILITVGALDPLVNTGPADETSSRNQWTNAAVVHDMLLLENQVPFVVVENIYQMAAEAHPDKLRDPFCSVVEQFVRNAMQKHANQTAEQPADDHDHQISSGKTVYHLLHLCHMLLEPPTKPANPGDSGGGHGDAASVRRPRRWHRAAQYHRAGVGLKMRSFDGGEDHRLLDLNLDVAYRGGTLEIPVLYVYDYTCSMLRNLTAMEQASDAGNYVTAYCVFLSRLMCTAEDVALLTKKGIVVHHLANDETVAALFADLCKNVVFDDDDGKCNYLRAACVAADERYQSRVRNWMTWLKHKHFSNPWLAMAAVAAVLVTICTVVQAVFAVPWNSHHANN